MKYILHYFATNLYLKNTYQQCQALTQSLESFYKKHGYLKANSKVGWIVHNSPLRFSGVSIPRYSKKKGSNMSKFGFSNLQKTLTTSKLKCWHTALFFHEVSTPKKKVLQTAGGYSITNYIPSVSETLENWFWRVLLVKSCQILSGTEQHHNIHCQGLVPWNSWNIKLLRPGMSREHQERLTL